MSFCCFVRVRVCGYWRCFVATLSSCPFCTETGMDGRRRGNGGIGGMLTGIDPGFVGRGRGRETVVLGVGATMVSSASDGIGERSSGSGFGFAGEGLGMVVSGAGATRKDGGSLTGCGGGSGTAAVGVSGISAGSSAGDEGTSGAAVGVSGMCVGSSGSLTPGDGVDVVDGVDVKSANTLRLVIWA